MGRSVAIADVPDPPLSTRCRDATLAHVLAVCCLSEHVLLDGFHGGEDGGIGLALLDDESVACLVTVLEIHGELVVCHVHSIDAGHCHSTELVTVYPLSQGPVPCQHEC